MGESYGVLATRVGTSLERTEAIYLDREGRLSGDAIDAGLVDRSVLKEHGRVLGRSAVSLYKWVGWIAQRVESLNHVQVVRSALAGRINDSDGELHGLVAGDYVIGKLSHWKYGARGVSPEGSHNSAHSSGGNGPPETCDDGEMTREEHLEWAKQRALKYLPTDPVEAMISMGSDLTKHPELENHVGLAIMPMFYGAP